MSETRPLTKNYLASHAYWALVCDAEPKLKGVEIGELTNYLNGTSKKLRENLRYAVKIIQREIEDINTEEARKAEIEEERRARERERARERMRQKRLVECSPRSPEQGANNANDNCKEKELLPPAPPTKEKEDTHIGDISLVSEPIAGADAGEAPKRTRFTPPTVEEVSAYIAEKGYHFDPESFVAYYASKGWTVGGKAPMKDWRMACVTWEKSWQERRLADCTDAPETAAEAERLAALSAPVPHYDMH